MLPPTTPQVPQLPLMGAKVMLLGETGSGKTYAIKTLIDAGLFPCVVFTENGMNTLTRAGVDLKKIAWHYVPPVKFSLDTMILTAKRINELSFEQLSDLGDIEKRKYNQFIDMLTCCADFKNDLTGQSLGKVDDWDVDKVLVIDSLSGLGIAAMALVVGAKPVKSQANWGVAMDNLERFVNTCCLGLKCHFVLTAHLEREVNEVAGGTNIMASTLGRKLAPKLPRYFDDVILCQLINKQFSWSTNWPNTVLKSRHLGLQDRMDPTFVPLVQSWRAANGVQLPKATGAVLPGAVAPAAA